MPHPAACRAAPGCLLPVLALVLGVPAPLPGQDTGALEGRVADEVGRPLASAEIVIQIGTLPPRARAMSDASGSWRVSHLPAGTYRVTVRRVGFRSAMREVQLEAGITQQVDVSLEAAPYRLDSLVVSAPAVRITTEDNELSTRLTVREISLLPTTLDLRPLLALTPGARPDQIWGGASDQANSYVLDGTLVNHTGRGGAFFLPSPNWIESVEVRGLGAGAEFGGFQGGSVEVTTLSGGPTLEGMVRAGAESHELNGSNLLPGEIGRELADRWEVDGQVRGPLIPGRLHFALFGRLIGAEERILNQLPDRGGEFVAQSPTLLDGRWLGKLSWAPGPRDLLQASVTGRHERGEHAGQTGFETVEASQRMREHALLANLTWRRTWSPRNALEVRAGGFLAEERRDGYAGPDVPGLVLLTDVNPPSYQNAAFRTRSKPSNVVLTALWTLRGGLAGLEHELKLGTEFTHGAFTLEQARSGGMSWRPLRVLGFDPGDPATWSDNNSIGTAWGGEIFLDSRVRSGAVFAQEHFRLTSWLHFNPGVRYAWWSGSLTPRAGPSFTAVRADGLEPRVGLVADLDGSGTFVAKAHWGRYHQSMFVALFDRVAGADAFSDEQIWSYLGPAPGSPTERFTIAQRDQLAASGGFRLDQEVRLEQAGRVEHYKQPYVDQTVVSLERSLAGRWKLGLAYVYRRNRDMVALVDRNLEANYTLVENVLVRDRFGRPLYFGGKPLVLDRLAISNEDILRVQELLRQGQLPNPGEIYVPAGVDPDEIRYEPDFVLTTVPEANRRFRQLQLRLDARYRTWWLGGSATLTTLKGNYNVVTGPDDYASDGPGPWVRLNEQFNFEGALNNQSRFEGKLHLGGLLPLGFRGGAFFSYATGDRVTPTLTVSNLLNDFAPTPDPAANTPNFSRFLFQTITGHRIFIQPRGSYRYQSRATLDLHLERSILQRGTEMVLGLDCFNILGDRSVVAIETHVNRPAGFFDSDYGRVRGRVPPRTVRLTLSARF